MDALFEFFRRNPVLLVVVAVWLFGLIGNIGKAVKQGRERAEQIRRQREAASGPVRGSGRVASPPAAARSEAAGRRTVADEAAVAREMRRILGLDPDEPATKEPASGDRGAVAATPRPAPIVVRVPRPRPAPNDVVTPEKPPTPVAPTTSRRRLEVHVDPHVGESIGKRARVGSGKVGEHVLGGLGGRAPEQVQRAVRGARYELDDLKRAFVLSEILGPPLASRPERRDD